LNKSLENAGKTIVETCSQLKPKEAVTIITDKDNLEIGILIQKIANEISTNINFHVLDDYGERPLSTLPKEIKVDLKKSDVTYYTAHAKKGEYLVGRLIMLATRSGREIHMPNIDETILKTGMQANYYKIASLTLMIMGIAVKSKTAKVTTPNGTDLNVSLSDKLKWIPDTGLLWYRGMWGNLPAGEVFTCPESVDGVMVVDGTLGTFFCEKYGNLEKTPVRIPIQNSRAEIEKISCDNKELLLEFRKYLKQVENANRVGEFACGTNIALKEFVGNLLQDEKFPGVHLAFGSPISEKTGANWNAGTHVDGVMQKCSLWFDERQIIENGKFIEKEIYSIY
jgi:leucyl aminopeptidase (aminopeptidase T)